MRASTEEDRVWAEALTKKRPPAVVFHGPTGIVAPVVGLEVGEGLVVLKLAGGHGLHVVRENFKELSVAEVRVWQIAVESLSSAVKELAVYASSVEKVERHAFSKLVAAALQAQARAVGGS